jgi:hypothetical protein
MIDLKNQTLIPNGALSKSPGKSSSSLGQKKEAPSAASSGTVNVIKLNPNLVPKTQLAIQNNPFSQHNDTS